MARHQTLECGGLPPLSTYGRTGRKQASAARKREQAPALQSGRFSELQTLARLFERAGDGSSGGRVQRNERRTRKAAVIARKVERSLDARDPVGRADFL